MKLHEFSEWAKAKGFINPLVEEEHQEEIRKGEPPSTTKTGNKVHTFVSATGGVVKLITDREGVIRRVCQDSMEADEMLDSLIRDVV
jgi:hypothetical protein